MDRSRSTFPAPRRVMTAPQGPVSKPSPSSQSAAGFVETLYNHPNVKIIAFTASGRSRARSPGRAPADEEPGSLPSSSQLERTIAVGPFRIYRAPGSVAFLNCGSALQPILPKSQCWCIDEVSSKFVLQIRRPQYWRIEVPVSDPQEQDLAHALRGVFDQILQFEKTECPFKRSFTIRLPEKPKTPVKKRPWTPARRSITPTAMTVIEPTPTPPSKTTRRKSESPAARQLKASMEATATAEERTKAQSESAPESSAKQQPESQQAPVNRSVDAENKEKPFEPAAEVEDQQEPTDIQDHEDPKLEEEKKEPAAVACSSIEAEAEPIKVAAAVEESPVPEPESTEIQTSKDTDEEADVEEVVSTPAPEESRVILSEATTPALTLQTQPRADVHEISTADSRTSPILVPVKEAEDQWEESPPLTAIRREEVPGISVEAQASEKSPAPAPEQTKTQARPDIHDFIRSYEQKAAVSVSSSTATETSPAAEETPTPAAHADDDSKSNASEESGQDGAGEGEASAAEILEGSGVVGARRKKLRGFRAGRSLAVPPQLTLITSPPSKSTTSRQSPTRLPEDARGPISPAGSSDSFHSVQSWQSPLSSPGSPKTPSTFPYPHDNILMPMRMSQYRDISDLTVTPDTKRTWDVGSCGTMESSLESAATAPDVASETAEQAGKDTFAEGEASSTAVARRRPSIRHRATTSSISVSRALSPLPPAANLFSPTATSTSTSVRRLPTRSRLDLVRRVPMAIVAKTCEILLSPPSHLMNLMLRVAARIAAGEWRGMMFGYGESGETIPVQWDYSDGELSDWGDDDDFYMSQAEGSRAASVADQEEAFDQAERSWEVD